jgi:hypothetical protein
MSFASTPCVRRHTPGMVYRPVISDMWVTLETLDLRFSMNRVDRPHETVKIRLRPYAGAYRRVDWDSSAPFVSRTRGPDVVWWGRVLSC